MGDTGICGEYEKHRLGRWQHLVGEFRLAADRIQPWRVEDAQSLSQQGVADVELGQAPSRDADV